MKIAHVSDIHLRNLKYHPEYKRVFLNLYEKLHELKPDVIVNTGDTAHTKTNISPEFVSLTSWMFTKLSEIAPLIVILGNHDLNLMNPDREDAISPIVKALNSPRIFLLKDSTEYQYEFLPNVSFHNFGIADPEHWSPGGPYDKNRLNIGLFHGSIRNCITDSNFRMTHVEYDTDLFEGLDFVLMGDIHKRQSFNGGRVWYAGSLIQQNYGEEPDKGFLLWDIKDKDRWTVDFHELHGARRFYTLRLNENLQVPTVDIEPDNHIRISPPRALTLVEQKAIEKLVRKKYAPHDIMTLGAQNAGQMAVGKVDKHRVENLRDTQVQQQLLRQFLAGRNISEEMMNRILELNHRYQVTIEQKEEMARGVNWRILKMGWNNLYNYGEGNLIDFSQIKGLTGIFAPNASGKSGLIDVVTVGMFDANTKEVSKNLHLVNDNKDRAAIILEVLANNDRYTVQREIERIKFVRKGQNQEWGKTTLDFVRHNGDQLEKLVYESRPDTERAIRRRFGNFEDFMLTSLFAQWDPMDLIMCKETDRKRILFRFLDLDIFEEKAKLAKEESKVLYEKLAELEENGYEGAIKELETNIAETEEKLEKCQESVDAWTAKIKETEDEIEKLLLQKVQVQLTGKPKDIELELAALGTKKALKQSELKKGEDEAAGKRAAIDQVLQGWDGFDLEEHQDKAEQYENQRSELANLKALHHDKERALAERKRQVGILDRVPCGDSYPTCQFLVDAFRAKKEMTGLEQTIAEHAREVEALETVVKELKEFNDRLDDYYTATADIESDQHRLDLREMKNKSLARDIRDVEAAELRLQEQLEQLRAVQEQLARNAQIDNEITVQRTLKVELERAVEKNRQELLGLTRKVGQDQGVLVRLKEAVAKLKDVRDACTSYEHFIDAMGKDGIALQVLTQQLPVINEEINKILGGATEFGVHIEYDADDQSIRLYIQYGQYKPRLLELGSGAEKFLASVAIRAALLSISNLPRSNMFIIDEGFGKLDPDKLEAIQRMFDYLKSIFDHVIVISHTELMKDMVDNIIDITTDDEGYAHVEIGS